MEKAQKNNTTRLDIQVDYCYLNRNEWIGSSYRVKCHDRAGNKYSFYSNHSFMAYLPTEWVTIEGQVFENTIKAVKKVLSISEARQIGVQHRSAKDFGFIIDFKKEDPHAWISEVRQPEGITEEDVMFAGEPLSPDGLTKDQEESAWAEFYGLYDETFTHPNQTPRL